MRTMGSQDWRNEQLKDLATSPWLGWEHRRAAVALLPPAARVLFVMSGKEHLPPTTTRPVAPEAFAYVERILAGRGSV